MDSQEMPSLLPPASSTSSESESSTLPSEVEHKSRLWLRKYVICEEEQEEGEEEDEEDSFNKHKDDFFNKYKDDFVSYLRHLQLLGKAWIKTIEEFKNNFMKSYRKLNYHNRRAYEAIENNRNSHSNMPPCLKNLKEKILDDLESGKLFKDINCTKDTLKFSLEHYLDRFECNILDSIAVYVLDSIYFIGEKCRSFSDDEKRSIGNGIIHAIESIKRYIFGRSYDQHSRVTTYVLQLRSALQFLVEEYGQFPADDNTTLSSKLEEAGIRESIEILDKIIHNWHNWRPFLFDREVIEDINDPGSDDSDDWRSDIDSDVESTGGFEVPISHRKWWFK